MYALFALPKSDTVPEDAGVQGIIPHCTAPVRVCTSKYSTEGHGGPLELGWIEGTEGADFSPWIYGARTDSSSASNCFHPAPASELPSDTTL